MYSDVRADVYLTLLPSRMLPSAIYVEQVLEVEALLFGGKV